MPDAAYMEGASTFTHIKSTFYTAEAVQNVDLKWVIPTQLFVPLVGYMWHSGSLPLVHVFVMLTRFSFLLLQFPFMLVHYPPFFFLTFSDALFQQHKKVLCSP